MLAESSPCQSQTMADGANGQGCTGHHAQRRVRQGVNPFCMQIIAEQGVEEFPGVFKLLRSLANSHRSPRHARTNQRISTDSALEQFVTHFFTRFPWQNEGTLELPDRFVVILIQEFAAVGS